MLHLDHNLLVEYAQLMYQAKTASVVFGKARKQMLSRADSFKSSHFHTPQERYLVGRFMGGYMEAKGTKALRYSRRTIEIFKSTKDIGDRCLTLAREGLEHLLKIRDLRIPFKININDYDLEQKRRELLRRKGGLTEIGLDLVNSLRKSHPEYNQGQILVVVDPADRIHDSLRRDAKGNSSRVDGTIILLSHASDLRRLAEHEGYHVVFLYDEHRLSDEKIGVSMHRPLNEEVGYPDDPLCIGYSQFDYSSPGMCERCADGAIYFLMGAEAALGEKILVGRDLIHESLKKQPRAKTASDEVIVSGEMDQRIRRSCGKPPDNS